MRYRTYGDTDVQVSEIGLGGHQEGVESGAGIARNARFFRSAQERARVIGRAIDLGVTYFDTTYGCEIASLGQSLRILGRRDGLFVSGMRVDFFKNRPDDKQDVRAYTRREVEARLSEFGFERLDQFLLGEMRSGDPLAHPRSILEDAFDELCRLRGEGKLRFIGFSCHEPDYAARLLGVLPQSDAVMVPYNFANRAAEGALADAIRKTKAALIAMKTLVWQVYGVPVTVVRNLRPVPGRLNFDPAAPIARLAHQWVLSNPLVTTCVPAVNSVEAVEENVAASGGGELSAEEETELQSYADAMIAEDGVLLAIGGLLEGNLRVRSNALAAIRDAFGWPAEEIDWSADDAEARCDDLVQDFLTRLRDIPKWSAFIPD